MKQILMEFINLTMNKRKVIEYAQKLSYNALQQP